MNTNVVIKSYSNGLKINLNPTCSFEDIINEITDKFTSSKNFFKGGKLVISFDGRVLSKDEEIQVVEAMEKSADLTVLYIVGKDEETNTVFKKAIDRPFKELSENSDARIYSGHLRKGSSLDVSGSVIIIGDIEPGAKVNAKGNVIVLGGIYGSVFIDSDECNDKFIAALDINAEKLQIGVYRNFSKDKPKWVVKPKMVPKIACVNNSQVIVSATDKEVIDLLIKRTSKE